MPRPARVDFKTPSLLIVLIGLGAGPGFAQAPPPAGFPGRAPEGPPAEIVRFELAPSAIEPGQSTTLDWEVLNAYSLSIEPGIGAVATRSHQTLAPPQTTTYVLTVTGTGGEKTARATVTVAGTHAASVKAAPGSAERAVPRLATGEPDLSGVYLGGRDVHVVGAAAIKPGAESFKVVQRPEDLGLGAQCLPPGVPGATLAPYPLQIVEKHDLVVILYEAYNIFRIIPLDRDHGDDLDPTWLGHSVGHWDGDTLVVDVVGFNDKTQLAGYHQTEALHVVERYRRKSFDKIEYTVSAEDPNVFVKPVRYAGELTLHPEWEIGEYICAENNKDYKELLSPEPSP
jgi:hypothetical protein